MNGQKLYHHEKSAEFQKYVYDYSFKSQKKSLDGPKNIEDAMMGAIASAFIGDSCGGVLEFNTVDYQLAENAKKMGGGGMHKLKPGQVTDDSEMAMCMAKSLAQIRAHSGDMNAAVFGCLLANNYNKWFKSNPFDIGQTTKNAVSQQVSLDDHLSVLKVYRNSAELNATSLSNGGLMRLSPMCIWLAEYYRDHFEKNKEETLNSVINATVLDTAITHGNPTAQVASCVYVTMLTHLIAFFDLPYKTKVEEAEKAVGLCLDKLTESLGKQHTERITGLFRSSRQTVVFTDVQNNIGLLDHGLSFAFNVMRHGRSFEYVLYNIIFKGGDTDTNAAIAMPIFGALYGKHNIPERFVNILDKAEYGRNGINFNARWYRGITKLLYYFCATETILKSIGESMDMIRDIQIHRSKPKELPLHAVQMSRMNKFVQFYEGTKESKSKSKK